jgi:hypothetical protein
MTKLQKVALITGVAGQDGWDEEGVDPKPKERRISPISINCMGNDIACERSILVRGVKVSVNLMKINFNA